MSCAAVLGADAVADAWGVLCAWFDQVELRRVENKSRETCGALLCCFANHRSLDHLAAAIQALIGSEGKWDVNR